MNRPVRANDVEVDIIRRARCRIDGCGWTGEDRPTYQAANDDRQKHLTWHRLGQPDPAQETTPDARRELAGRDLACWCHPGDPCHADVLLELANTPEES